MKTAISIPDVVFRAADQAARRLRVSRSQLYTRAIEEFLEVYAPSNVIQRLDEVYGENPSGLDPNLADLQARSLGDDSW